MQPLWTFGRLDATETLAREGLATQQARSALTGENVAFDATRAYWALAAAAAGEAIARNMRRDFDKLQREVEKRVADESSGVSDADLFEVRTSSYSIDRLYLDALEAPAHRRGRPARGPEPARGGASPRSCTNRRRSSRSTRAAPRRWSPGRSRRTRRCGRMTAATRVLAAKVELQRASRNPVLFLAAGAGYANAGNRDEQDNPWASEEFNYASDRRRDRSRLGHEPAPAGTIDVSAAEAERRSLSEKLEGARALGGRGRGPPGVARGRRGTASFSTRSAPRSRPPRAGCASRSTTGRRASAR